MRHWAPRFAAAVAFLALTPVDVGSHGAEIHLAARAVMAGDSLGIRGEGLGENQPIEIVIEGAAFRTRLAKIQGDDHGRFEIRVLIPAGAPAGSYRVVATAGEDEADASLSVLPPRGATKPAPGGVSTAVPDSARADAMPLNRRRTGTEATLAWGAVVLLVAAGVWLYRRPRIRR